MHPALSIGIYIAAQIVILMLMKWCLDGSRTFSEGKALLTGVKAAGILAYALLALLPITGALLPDSRIKYLTQAAGNIWMGFYVYFSGVFLILYFFLGIWHQIGGIRQRGAQKTPAEETSHPGEKSERKVIRNGRLRLAAITISTAVGLFTMIYGMIHATQVVVTDYDVTIHKDADDISDFRVVLLGDLHMSVNSYPSHIARMVELVNEQDADLIVIAGDIFTSTYRGLRNPERYAEMLRGMKAKYGVYAVYGNHDVEENLFGGFPISPISEAFRTAEMEEFFKDCGLTVLYDETVRIADGALLLTGRIDGEKAGDGTAIRMSPQEVLKEIDRTKPVLVLQHEPVEFGALKEAGADLALCGHTHAGQIFPGNLIVPFFNENAYGYKEVGGLDTIVTSGVGYYGPPMRVGTNSEITVVNLHFSK